MAAFIARLNVCVGSVGLSNDGKRELRAKNVIGLALSAVVLWVSRTSRRTCNRNFFFERSGLLVPIRSGPKADIDAISQGPSTVPRACRSKTHYFIVTLASARAGECSAGHMGLALPQLRQPWPRLEQAWRSFAGGVRFPPVSFVCSFSSPLRAINNRRSEVQLHVCSTCAWYQANVASLWFCIACIGVG